MATKVAINGFGRIGRCVLRALHQRGLTNDIEVVAINDLTSPATLAHLLKYDSVHRRFTAAEVTAAENGIVVGGKEIRVTAIRNPADLPWKELGVDVVLECTGLFTNGEDAAGHIKAGAKKVIISAPAKGHDLTVVMGVNQGDYDASKHNIISNGSCTTNCLAPVAKVLLKEFGIKSGLMTTIHSYTNDQAVLDVPHRKGDLRRARAAALSMIPTSTGAAAAVSQVIPELKGKFDGLAVRVPTMDVSLVDLSIETDKTVTVESINKVMAAAAESSEMKGYLYYTDELLVSTDFIGHEGSSIFDGTMTKVQGDKFAKVFSWYDNEWGFSNRMLDITRLVSG